ncbi:MAG: hypothetical protein RIS35_44 [Pseudomonadota bacterium]|jgi:Fe-S-cluster containining protein
MSACLTCGACCITFRVDFSVYETDAAGGQVPVGMTVEVNGNRCRMRGTDRFPIRCDALEGEIGSAVGCSIYERRPSPCRAFEERSDRCNQARIRHGLQPIGVLQPD